MDRLSYIKQLLAIAGYSWTENKTAESLIITLAQSVHTEGDVIITLNIPSTEQVTEGLWPLITAVFPYMTMMVKDGDLY